MTRGTTAIVLFLLLGSNAFADGFHSRDLKEVLLETDAIILVEIVENKRTIKNREEGGRRKSVAYTNDIKSKVLSSPGGEFAEKVFNTKYSLVLCKGVWLCIPGSGLEGYMKAGERYVFLLRKRENKYSLYRAEKAEMLEEILQLKKEQVEEDRRVAKEQEEIPNGIYSYSDAAEAQKVRLQDGRRIRIGEQCKFNIVRKELHSRYNLILLTLTLSDKPGKCVLIVNGKAYWLFDHHWAAVQDKASAAERAPTLYCSFSNREDAEAVADAFKVAIVYPQPQDGKKAKQRTTEEGPPDKGVIDDHGKSRPSGAVAGGLSQTQPSRTARPVVPVLNE